MMFEDYTMIFDADEKRYVWTPDRILLTGVEFNKNYKSQGPFWTIFGDYTKVPWTALVRNRKTEVCHEFCFRTKEPYGPTHDRKMNLCKPVPLTLEQRQRQIISDETIEKYKTHECNYDFVRVAYHLIDARKGGKDLTHDEVRYWASGVDYYGLELAKRMHPRGHYRGTKTTIPNISRLIDVKHPSISSAYVNMYDDKRRIQLKHVEQEYIFTLP